MKPDYSISVLCTTLRVSPSTYYDWLERQATPGVRALEDQLLSAQILAIHTHSRQTYGSPRIVAALRQAGRAHGRKRVTRLMRQANLCGRQKARYRLQTTDSNHDQPIALNLMAETVPATAPNQIWVGDITYIETQEGWLYLAAVLDRYSRKIVGWAMSERIDTTLVLNALAMARRHRQPTAQILFHSDRGVQYASADYRHALTQAGCLPSMSSRGNCYDNATMESFWSTLKLELVYRTSFRTRAQARTQIFDYIESFYNRRRLHSSLAYLTPILFESKIDHRN